MLSLCAWTAAAAAPHKCQSAGGFSFSNIMAMPGRNIDEMNAAADTRNRIENAQRTQRVERK